MKPILHQAIHIKLKPNYLMLSLLSVISIACCLILFALPIAALIKLFAMILVLISSTYFGLRDCLLMLPWSWQRLEVDIKSELLLTNQRGQQFVPDLADSSFIHGKLTILNFKRDGFKFALPPTIILMDITDDMRRLRVWLRWAKQHNLIETIT